MDKKTEKDNSEYIKEVFKLLKIALGITLILLLIVIVSNHFLPDSRKFDKEIWGSVSDWFTYLVTLIGGVFIYKTLESQMKVQGDQNEILKLEKQKYRREKRPNLTYTLSIDRTRKSGAPYLVVIEFNSDKDTDIEFYQQERDRLINILEDASFTSHLPSNPNAKVALSDFLVKVRMSSLSCSTFN